MCVCVGVWVCDIVHADYRVADIIITYININGFGQQHRECISRGCGHILINSPAIVRK